jgi:hypothetical protein
MEHAPLRPVPARPAGPIDPAAATRAVAAWLPTLPPEAVDALALVGFSERPRGEVATSLGVSERDLGELLASARKELRQTLETLPGSGWCERAEGLISDRLDGPLADVDARRLDVHLRNCARCVEHERRLVQATDAVVFELGGIAGGGGGTVVPLVEVPPPGEDAALPEIVEPAQAPSDAEIAAAAEVLVAVRTRRQIAAAVAWNAMIALAVLLVVAAIAISVAGILGAQL